MKKAICAVLTIMMGASLAACGSNGTTSSVSSAASEAEKTVVSESASAETEAEKTSAAEPAKELKVALCLSGAANDQGWNQSAYEGAKKACDKYGYSLDYTENLQTADIASAFTDYASAGYDIIIGHGFEFGDPAVEVAETYPNVKFICTEADASADNVASYVMACEQTAYVEGVIAAKMTKSNVIGAIGPVQGDSLVKIVNGYEDGAKSVNPDMKVETAWTNSYTDTQLAQEAARAMIDDGADVIKHCANACGTGAINAAVDAKIYCQGDSYDQSSLAPDNMVDSALYNLDVVLDDAIGQIHDSTFKGGVYNLGIADGAVDIAFTQNISDDAKKAAQETMDKIKSGELKVVRDYTIRKS